MGVTLAGVFLGTWTATKKHGAQLKVAKYNDFPVEGKLSEMREAEAIFPCVLVVYHGHWREEVPNAHTWEITRTKVIWLFGPTIRLPFESVTNEYPRWRPRI